MGLGFRVQRIGIKELRVLVILKNLKEPAKSAKTVLWPIL
jgi:hypothetical protein